MQYLCGTQLATPNNQVYEMSPDQVSNEQIVWENPMSSEYFRRDTFEENTAAEQAILGLVLRRGPLTQLDIAREIDRSQQTVSRLISRLIKRGSLRVGCELEFKQLLAADTNRSSGLASDNGSGERSYDS